VQAASATFAVSSQSGFVEQPHTPAKHWNLVVAPPCTAHALPQAPQWSESVVVFVSQPSSGTSSALSLQLAKLARHVGAQLPALQTVVTAFANSQVRAHLPQFVTSSASRAFSQPVVASLSQLPNPAVQLTAQAPAEHVADELGPLGQGSQELAEQPWAASFVTHCPAHDF